MKKLTDKKKEFLRKIIDLEEVSASKLAEEFSFTRNAAVQHLRAFKEKHLLDSKEKDRIMYYYVPTEIVDEIDEVLEKLKK